MNDKELLELAAKATNIKAEWLNGKFWIGGYYSGREFNPLTDDGDALRLAVKSAVLVGLFRFLCLFIRGLRQEKLQHDEPYAATRRAIVRAAAEIGKEMK